MNMIPEPAELLESECNAQGLYGLPEPLLSANDSSHGCAEPEPSFRLLASPAPGSGSADDIGV